MQLRDPLLLLSGLNAAGAASLQNYPEYALCFTGFIFTFSPINLHL